MGSAGTAQASIPLKSAAPFVVFTLFIIDFFLHLEGRLTFLGVLRPSLILAGLEILLLISAKNELRGRLSAPPAAALLRILIWIVATLPFIAYPGSVLRDTWEPFFKAVAFFYFAALTLDTRRRLVIFLSVFIGCQLFRVLEPLALHLTTGYWGDAAYIGDGQAMNRLAGAPSDVINSNQLAFVIISVFPFLHYLLLSIRAPLAKVAYFGLAAILIYALVLTGSRGGLVGLLVMIVVMIYQARNRMAMLAAAICGTLFVIAHLSGIQADRYLSLVDDNTRNAATAEGRTEAMWHDFDVGMAHPIFGSGVGTSPEARYHAIGHAKIAHDMYGEAFIELGVVGLVLVVAFIGSVLMTVHRMWRELRKSGQQDGLEGQVLRAVIAWFWMAAVYNFAQFGVSEYHWYLMAGLISALATMAGAPVSSPVRATRPRYN